MLNSTLSIDTLVTLPSSMLRYAHYVKQMGGLLISFFMAPQQKTGIGDACFDLIQNVIDKITFDSNSSSIEIQIAKHMPKFETDIDAAIPFFTAAFEEDETQTYLSSFLAHNNTAPLLKKTPHLHAIFPSLSSDVTRDVLEQLSFKKEKKGEPLYSNWTDLALRLMRVSL